MAAEFMSGNHNFLLESNSSIVYVWK
jgi:hypothetical protein